MKKTLICEVCKKYKVIKTEEEFNREVQNHQNRYHLRLNLKPAKKSQLNLFTAAVDK